MEAAPRPEPARTHDRYGIALGLLILTIVALSLAGEADWGRAVGLALEGATLLFILHTSRAGHRTVAIAAIVVGAAVTGASIALLVGSEGSDAGPWAIGAFLALVAPVAIFRRLRRVTRVTPATIFGALCLYLLGGLFFAFVYGMIGAIGDASFFAQKPDPITLDYVYYSFVTLATVGYGDLTAQSDVGRMLSVSEALLGQLYLVSVVALLVSNLGRSRSSRVSESNPDESETDRSTS